MSESYYDRLGVSPDASTAEIEAAYRDRLKETHPDVSDDANASDRTKELIEARDVLTDEAERARYDRLGHERYLARQNGVDVSGGTDADESPTPDDVVDGVTSNPGSGTGTATDFSAHHRNWNETQSGTGDPADKTGWTRGETDGQRFHDEARQHAGQANTEDRTDDSSTWRAWDTDAPFSLRDDGLQRSRLFPASQSVILLSSTFALYPLLLWGALLPAFPLAVNLVVAACLLGVVAFLQSMPEVGVVVFGVWSVILPSLFVALGVDPFAFPAAAALLATVLPLGLSVLTRAVVRT